jgi:hypothetical protein
MFDDGGDARPRLSIAVRKRSLGHGRERGIIAEQPSSGFDNPIGRGADEDGVTDGHAFGPLRLLAEDQQGTPSAGASSWIPPESLSTKSEWRMCWSSPSWLQGLSKVTFSTASSRARMRAATQGFG